MLSRAAAMGAGSGRWFGSAFVVVLEVRPRRDVDAVIVRRCKRLPLGGLRVVRDPTAHSERGRDPSFGLIGRHTDVERAICGAEGI